MQLVNYVICTPVCLVLTVNDKQKAFHVLFFVNSIIHKNRDNSEETGKC